MLPEYGHSNIYQVCNFNQCVAISVYRLSSIYDMRQVTRDPQPDATTQQSRNVATDRMRVNEILQDFCLVVDEKIASRIPVASLVPRADDG
jgi:hypothetical protein